MSAGFRGPAVAFLAFGVFWGAWAALLPATKAGSAASAGELGLALLAISAAALPAMLLTGRLIDHVRRPLVAPSLAAFAVAALVPAFPSTPWQLAAALVAVGVTTGAVDVAINASVSALEEQTGRRLMQTAHALFSAGVVVASIAVGLAREAGAGRVPVLVATAAVVAVAALLNTGERTRPAETAEPGRGAGVSRFLVVVGVLGALGFLVEGGAEGWGALFVEQELEASPAVSGLGPACFAAAMVAGRLAAGAAVARLGERTLLVAASVAGAGGLVLVATAQHPLQGLAGLAVAGAGVSVGAPTLFSLAGRAAGPASRGSAVATATTIAYLGFFAGPPLIGLVADAAGLRVSFLLLGAISLVLAAAAAAALPRQATT